MLKRLPKLSTTRLILGAAVLVAAYFLVGFGFNTIRAHQLSQQEGQIKSEISALQDRYQRLSALKDYLNSDEYVETVAREQLGLVKVGETGFVGVPTQPSPTPGPGQEQPSLWWDILIR